MAPISLKKGRVEKITEDLITSLTGIKKNTENFNLSLEYAVSNFRFHRFLDVNSFEVKRKLDGLSEKFLIHCQHRKSEKLKELKEKFLSSALSASQFTENTEEHYGVLSLLLNLSDSPIHHKYAPSKKEEHPATEDVVDWTEYLLGGEEKEELGICLPREQLAALEESDEEFETTVAILTEDSNKEKLVNPSDISKVSKHSLEIEQHQRDLAWLQENIITQYWNGKSNATIQIESGYDLSRHTGEVESTQIILRTFEASSSQFSSKLTEAVIMRETLWMLQGLQCTFVYSFADKQYRVRQGVTMGHTSQESLQKVLESFAVTGSRLQALKSYVSEVRDMSKPNLRTLRAFGYSVSSFLKRVKKDLSVIETEIIKGVKVYTCLTLAEAIKDISRDSRLVFDLFEECITKASNTTSSRELMTHVINTLYSAVCRLDSHGSSGIGQLTVVLPIFLETIRPFLSDLGNWVSLGKLPTTSNAEFFIEKSSEKAEHDSDVWYNTYQIISRTRNGKTEALVPEFIANEAQKILLAGKSRGLLEEAMLNSTDITSTTFDEEFLGQFFENLGITASLELIGDKIKDDTGRKVAAEIRELVICEREFSSLLAENFSAVFQSVYQRIFHPSGRTGDNSSKCIQDIVENNAKSFANEATCRLPIKLIFERTLRQLIDSRYKQASKALIHMFKDRYKLNAHLSVMKDFFFMQAGDVMSMFYSELFTKIRNGEFWRNTSYLTSALHESLCLRFPDLVKNLMVGVNEATESRKMAKSQSIQSVNGIFLRYHMEWPLTIIFDNKVEEKYNAIFVFLLQVKRALWSLEQLRVTDLNVDCLQPRIQLKQKLYVLRVRLLHFVQSFHVYLMTRILHSSGLEFAERLQNARDFEDILAGHAEFLDKVYDRCLLGPKVGFAKEAITRILSCCLSFQAQWDRGLHEIEEEDVVAVETEFDKCSRFIQSFLNSLIKRGSFPHLQLLSLSLQA